MKIKAIVLSLYVFNLNIAFSDTSVDKLIELENVKKLYDVYLQTYPVQYERIPSLTEEVLLGKNNPTVIKLIEERKRIHSKYFSWSKFKKKYQDLYLKIYSEEERLYLISIYQSDIGRSVLKKHYSLPFHLHNSDRKEIQKYNEEIRKINSEYQELLEKER